MKKLDDSELQDSKEILAIIVFFIVETCLDLDSRNNPIYNEKLDELDKIVLDLCRLKRATGRNT